MAVWSGHIAPALHSRGRDNAYTVSINVTSWHLLMPRSDICFPQPQELKEEIYVFIIFCKRATLKGDTQSRITVAVSRPESETSNILNRIKIL